MFTRLAVGSMGTPRLAFGEKDNENNHVLVWQLCAVLSHVDGVALRGGEGCGKGRENNARKSVNAELRENGTK